MRKAPKGEKMPAPVYFAGGNTDVLKRLFGGKAIPPVWRGRGAGENTGGYTAVFFKLCDSAGVCLCEQTLTGFDGRVICLF